MSDLCHGWTDFEGKRLNVLQIGLGTFGTFFQNLISEEEAYADISWILSAASETSKTLLGVGVEPITEHVQRLVPRIAQLPYAAVVHAAVGRRDADMLVHSLSSGWISHMATLEPDAQQSFSECVEYLRNMSCVGQLHPCWEHHSKDLEERFGFRLASQQGDVKCLSYEALAKLLNFSGTEVLIIDTEGHDCQILLSMVDCCTREGSSVDSWPDVIQFESMGHCDAKDGASAEESVCRTLEQNGYLLACIGKDTQLVKKAALTESRVDGWAKTLRCERCGVKGCPGMPFNAYTSCAILCRSCNKLLNIFNCSAWDGWRPLHAPAQVIRMGCDGSSLWAVDAHGKIRSHSKQGGFLDVLVTKDLKQFCVTAKHIWGVDGAGRILRRCMSGSTHFVSLPEGCSMKYVAASGDGQVVWAIDDKNVIHVYVCADGRWCTKNGWLAELSVSWDGAHVWGVNHMGQVWYCNGIMGEWLRGGDGFKSVVVSGNGHHIWGLSHDNSVYHRTQACEEWCWLPGLLTQLCVSHDGSKVWGLDPLGEPWLCESWIRE